MEAIASRADDDKASIVSKKSTSPAVMFASGLVIPSAMTWTEKIACVANLPHLHTHTRALPAACCCYGVAVLRLLVVLLLQLPMPMALSSLITCKGKTKEKKNVFFSPTTNFLVGNHGLRRAERWDDMPSMSSEVGEI